MARSKRSAKRGANPGTKRKRSTTKKGGAKRKGGKRKGGAKGFQAEVRQFMTKQRKWNYYMERSVSHLYTATKTSRPKAFSRLPRV